MFLIRLTHAAGFVLATVTRNVRQFMVGCFLALIAFIALSEFSVTSNSFADTITKGPQSWLDQWLGPILYSTIALAVVLWQYARRQTTTIRLLLGALLLWGVVPEVLASPIRSPRRNIRHWRRIRK